MKCVVTMIALLTEDFSRACHANGGPRMSRDHSPDWAQLVPRLKLSTHAPRTTAHSDTHTRFSLTKQHRREQVRGKEPVKTVHHARK